MKLKIKKLVTLAVVSIMVVQLTACGQFDASAYVKSTLDARYHEKYDEYAKITDMKEEDIKNQLEENTKTNINLELATLTGLDESDKQAYYDTMMEVYAKTKYEVKEAEKNGDNFVVAVEISPLDTMETFNAGITAKLQEKFADATATTSNKDLLAAMMDYMKECNENSSYKDPVTIEVDVVKEGETAYTISDEQVMELENALVPSDQQ